LDQGNVVFVDGLKRNLPVYSDHMMIRKRGGWIVSFYLYIVTIWSEKGEYGL